MLNKHNLGVVELSSKDDSRITICNLRVEKDCTVATDGRTIMKVTRPKYKGDLPEINGMKPEEDISFSLSREEVKIIQGAIPKNKKGELSLPVLQNAFVEATKESDKIKIGTTDTRKDTVVSVGKRDGDYPKYQEVMKLSKEDFKGKIRINIKYLLKMAKAFSSFSANDIDGGAVNLSIYDKEDNSYPRVVLEAMNTETDQTAKAILMGMKSEN